MSNPNTNQDKLAAIILAAGSGTRLNKVINNLPKCMIKIGETSLIERQIEWLKLLGIGEKNIFVITGYKSDQLIQHLNKKFKVKFIFNPCFKTRNNIYSFYLIEKILNFKHHNYLILHSDLYFDFGLTKLTKDRFYTGKNYILIDKKSKLENEEMKVIVKKNLIRKISKNIDPKFAHGEYLGIAKFTKQSLIRIIKNISHHIKNKNYKIFYDDTFNDLIPGLKLEFINVEKIKWIEIDTPADYYKAKKLRFSGELKNLD